MNDNLKNKLSLLPAVPGVYFHKSDSGEIIYIGKAAVLKNRVRQYFQDSRTHDVKTEALVAEIYDTDWVETASELDALFLESEMVKRYMPRYNVLLRDDKSQLFVRIDMKNEYPHISFTRQPLDDGAQYWGPYFNGFAVKKALRILRRAFPYSTHRLLPSRVCLQYHLNLCPGVEEKKISSLEYKKTLRKLIRYIKGEGQAILKEVVKDMKSAAQAQEFERAAVLRNQYRHLSELQNQIIFGDREFLDISKDEALSGITHLLGLKKLPYRIEGYDISHMSGTNNAASMVVATNGLPDKKEYRKFKLRVPGNDDFAHMRETLSRRFSGRHKDWPLPDLLLIDGGKGQLSAAIAALAEARIAIPVIGLAKREEEIVIHHESSNVTLSPGRSMVVQSDDFCMVRLARNSHIVKLLQRIRDESHRFAVSYHTTLKRQQQTSSALDSIAGIGPATRKKLLRAFGSLKDVIAAEETDIAAIVGDKKASLIKRLL